MKIKYTAHATARHGGRGVGDAATDDGKVSVKFSQPKAMGGDNGPGGILNRPTNHTSGGLREHERCHGKIRNNPQDQVPLHLIPPRQKVVPCRKVVKREQRPRKEEQREHHHETCD